MDRNRIIMRTFIAMAAIGAALLFSCTGGKKPVTLEQLPAPLRTLVTEHFPGESLAYATLEREGLGKKYELVLSNGTEIEADSDGQWKEIKCTRGNAVPSGVLPVEIKSYLEAKHPQTEIRKVEKKKRGHELELSNGLEITFDENHIVKEYDH